MRYLRKIVLTILALPMLAAASYTVTDSGVVFIYRNPSARQVALSGSFVNWDPNGIPMKQDSAGVFVAIVKLSPGTYQYKFIVDGAWTEDPDNPNKVDDGYGGFNSVAEVRGTVQKAQSGAKEGRAEFKYYNPDARQVYLTGDFANWDPKAIPMVRQPDGTWIARVDIPPGEHEYKFVVDGVWTADPLNPVTRGEFGNSVIIIKPDGTAQYPAGAQQLANSVASSRILFSGAARAFMLTFRDRDLPGGYYGDGRWKLYRPLAKFDVNMRIHIAQGVTGFGSFDVNTFDADRLYEAHLRLDSAGVEIAPQSFTLNAFFNRQIAAPEDILGIVGGYPYAEPTFEAPQKFGLGFGGIDFRTDFAGTFLRGTSLALVVANMYEDWTLEPDSLDFLNLFGRRPLGFWRRQVATAEPPTDFSNFGTDVVVFRVARDFGFFSPALNVRVDRNQWWLPTSEISYSRFDSIYDANGLHSDWVDLGALETGIAPEINLKVFDDLELGGEYLLWQYRSSIDAGNRENHDHTADSTLDITLGTQRGYLFGGQIRWSFAEGTSVALYGEREHYDAMDSSQTYILPRHNDGSTGRPTLEFITPGEFDRQSFSGKIELSGRRHSLSAAGEYESAGDLYDYVGGSLKGNVQLWDDRLILRGIFALRTGKYCGDALKFSDFDAVGAAKFNFWRDLWFAADVWFKKMSRQPQSSDYPDSVWKVDETIFAPYAGIVYQPKPSVEFEVSAGVRPYNVNGYYTGRSEWIYDTMRDNEISYIDALKRLSLFQGINIYAVMKF